MKLFVSLRETKRWSMVRLLIIILLFLVLVSHGLGLEFLVEFSFIMNESKDDTSFATSCMNPAIEFLLN